MVSRETKNNNFKGDFTRMRKLKRMIALVTVAMFLFSFAVAPAMAATKEDAFGRLKALSVAVGDATGNPQFDKNFTRAEAAAIMVNLQGMNAAINSAKGATKFKDVPASHWASGVINLAVGAGVIKGYPDGTYKPDANVTYAEMSAMLVGVLGYTPKLQGTWPANVIGKAAQLGVLDGITVSDVNAAAVRSNVFLASDNSLDVKVLKETKDGYDEGKTLMEEKLTVTILKEAEVLGVPNTTGTKNEVQLGTYEGSGSNTYGSKKTVESFDPNPFIGLKVEAWIKDDKVFFLNTKTSSSDVIVDKVGSMLTSAGATHGTSNLVAGDQIKTDDSEKTYSVATGFKFYENYKAVATPVVNTNLVAADEIKLILENGQIKTIIANRFATDVVDKVNTADEKITLKVNSAITIKDKVATITKGGKAIGLADIKSGDVVDYVSNTNGNGSYYIVVTSGDVVEGKLTAAASDGKTLTIGTTSAKATGSVRISTDNGQNYTVTLTTSGTYTTHFGKTAKAFKNKNGKIAFMILSDAAEASNWVPVVVKDIKYSNNGAISSGYLYVAKFDGTETYYEVNKDSKVNGKKIDESYLKNAGSAGHAARVYADASNEITRGEIVKMALTSDGKIDNMREFDSSELVGLTTNYSTNKTADTIAIGSVAYKVDSNAKILKVKKILDFTDSVVASDTTVSATYTITPASNYIDDVEALTWAATENIGTDAGGGISIIKDGGIAKYVVMYNPQAKSTTALKYGMVISTSDDSNGTQWAMKVEGADMTKKYDNGVAGAKGDLVKFKLNSDNEIDSAAYVNFKSDGSPLSNYYLVYTVDKANKRIEVLSVQNEDGTIPSGSASKFWIDVNDSTKYFNVHIPVAFPQSSSIHSVTATL